MGVSRILVAITAVLALGAAAVPARAAVERVEVLERVPFAPGQRFGDIGAYEKIRAIAHFALDPKTAANTPIIDLARAPRDADGKVRFTSEFILLRPAGTPASSLIYDVNN